MWPVWWHDSEIDYISKINKLIKLEWIDFLHAGTNSGNLNVDIIIFGLTWSKMATAF